MFVRMPNNKWLWGKWYEYNADQDKSRKEVRRLIDDGSFVKDDDYDDYGYSTIPIEKRYKQFVDKSIRSEWATNARNITKNKQILIDDDLGIIKVNDRFKTMEQSDDAVGFKIVELDINRNTDKAMATHILPGAFHKYNSEKLVTLQ